MNQREFIYDYNDKYRPKFNNDLFVRTDDDLINALKNIIYSCQREQSFVIKVMNFEVIENYDDINHILWEYEDNIINKGKKSSSKKNSKNDNQFAFINLKDSDLKLIKVTYFIQINEKKNGLVNDTLSVYIAIPRIIDDFYFKINGNVYSAMYQIVDASTYNNSAAKSAKKQSITFKTVFMPLRLYRYSSFLKDIDGNNVPCTYFVANAFKKSLLVMKYIIVKFGLIGAMDFLKIKGVNLVKNYYNINKENDYIFPVRDMYVTVPKILYNSVQIIQSFVYTLLSVTNYMKDTSYEDMFDTDTWTKALGAEFTSKDLDTIRDKGENIIESLSGIYDLITKNDLRLCDDDKRDIYCLIRWMMYEFNALRQKDNLDITTKKVRWAEYIASLYAEKLAFGIYRISDKGNTADLNTIRKAIQIPPMYLINAISKCQLVNYKSCVNDIDALIALKYTYKGVSGIGEKSNAISSAYRSIHPSHLGRVDIDSSSNSDPGVSGTLCPLTKLYDGHFDKYEEPSTWRTELARVMDMYNAMKSKLEMCRIVENNGLRKPKDHSIINECISITKDLLYYPTKVNNEIEMLNSMHYNGMIDSINSIEFGDTLMVFLD